MAGGVAITVSQRPDFTNQDCFVPLASASPEGQAGAAGNVSLSQTGDSVAHCRLAGRMEAWRSKVMVKVTAGSQGGDGESHGRGAGCSCTDSASSVVREVSGLAAE